MQAHLKDIASSSKSSVTFVVCQRMLQRCHEIIFDDASEVSPGPYSSLKAKSRALLRRRRVKHHVLPALVGIACMLSGPAQPAVSLTIGPVAIEQGRVPENNDDLRSVESLEDDVTMTVNPIDDQLEDEPASGMLDDEQMDSNIDTQSLEAEDDIIKDHNLFKSIMKTRRRSLEAELRASLPTLTTLRSETIPSNPRQRMNRSPSKSPSHSTPVLQLSRRSTTLGSGNVIDTFLQDYPIQTQKALLQGHYCRTEVCGYAILICWLLKATE